MAGMLDYETHGESFLQSLVGFGRACGNQEMERAGLQNLAHYY